MILVIDNYDSFTYNLVQYIGEFRSDIRVYRNDEITVEEVRKMAPERIVISPGPCTPYEAGVSIDIIRELGPKIPIFGVCLGHQAIGAAFGGRVVKASRLVHGKTSVIEHDGTGIFKGVQNPLTAVRYHSLALERESLPRCLKITATAEDGTIMGVKHVDYPIVGVQFHPESIMTSEGKKIIKNMLEVDFKMNFKDVIVKVVEGRDLTEEEAGFAMERIMEGEATPAQIGSFITALRMKGEKVEEITGFARVMREKAEKIVTRHRILMDTCGTGGDRSNSFNISTAAAFVIAGTGVAVAKHGNRSVSSRSGSADVLEALGVNINMKPAEVGECIDKIGLGFMFAPVFHGAMKFAAGPRREVGIRTVFNILGPLTNPAGPQYQLLGVYHPDLTEPVAHVLKNMGVVRAMVVHGMDSLDEISISGVTKISEVRDGEITTYYISPQDFGIEQRPLSEIQGYGPKENSRILMGILEGQKNPYRDVVLINAAAALVVCGTAENFKDGICKARDSIDSGRALNKLKQLQEFSGRFAKCS